MKLTYKTTTLACRLSSISQAIAVMAPSILFSVFQDNYGMSYAQMGTLILVMFVVQIGVDYLLSLISHKTDARMLMVTCCALNIGGFILMALVPVLFAKHIYGGLLLACLFYSAGCGINEVMSSPVTDALPSDDKGSSMAFLHSFYCWGCLLAILGTTLMLRIFGKENWQWVLVIWTIVPLTDLILFLIAPFPEMVSGHEDGNHKTLLKSGLFWAAVMVMIASGASEQAMSQWASMFTQRALGLNKTIGDIVGPCFFAITMGLGRLYYGFMGEKINMRKALMISSALCIVSYLLAVFAPNPVFSLVGLGLCGLSVSMMWPGTLVLSSKAIPTGGTALFALLALGGDIGCSAGPWATGMISDALLSSSLNEAMHLTADQFSLRGGLLFSIVFPVLLMVSLPILTREKK